MKPDELLSTLESLSYSAQFPKTGAFSRRGGLPDVFTGCRRAYERQFSATDSVSVNYSMPPAGTAMDVYASVKAPTGPFLAPRRKLERAGNQNR